MNTLQGSRGLIATIPDLRRLLDGYEVPVTVSSLGKYIDA